MATFCHFYKMTPAEFWDLDEEDYDALGRYIVKYNKAMEEASRRR